VGLQGSRAILMPKDTSYLEEWAIAAVASVPNWKHVSHEAIRRSESMDLHRNVSRARSRVREDPIFSGSPNRGGSKRSGLTWASGCGIEMIGRRAGFAHKHNIPSSLGPPLGRST
jgi:hypothetical protein